MAAFDDLPLFSTPAADPGQQGKECGMAQVWQNASAEFRDTALLVVRQAARLRPEISANDLWDGLEVLGIYTHDNRAAGPVMSEAARRGWIVSTERMIKTTRPTRHKGDVRLWRSLLHSR